MSERRSRTANGDRISLERRIEDLRRQSQDAARTYQAELQRLQEQLDNSVRQANEELIRRHRQELDAVAAAYNEQRMVFRRELEAHRQEQNRRLEEEKTAIDQRISRVENRLETQLNEERMVADEYRARMRSEWEDLLACENLRPFVDVHADTVELAEQSAERAYGLRQYQAVTAIMVNSSALIRCWETEAQALWEEWQVLFELCRGVVECMNSAVTAAADQLVDCDGDVKRVCLTRYDEAGFARGTALLRADRLRLEEAKSLSIEQMRLLLHELERDRRFIDGVVEGALVQHRAHVRRLRCMAALTEGLKKREYYEAKAVFEGGDLLKGLRILYCSRYYKDRLLVTITTPQPETGTAQIDVILLPGAAVDERLQYSRCNELTVFATSLVEGQARRPSNVRANEAYRNQNGLYQATVTLNYEV